MKFYQRYPGDYGKKTARLTLAEHGAYALLMDEVYSTEVPLPADLDELCRICRAISKIERDAVIKVVEKFFPLHADGLRHNERIDEELAKAQPKIEAAKENGKKGGRPKKKNPEGTQEKPSGLSQENPLGSEKSKKQNPAETHSESYPEPEPEALTATESIRRSGSTRTFADDDCPTDWEGWRQFFEVEHGLEHDPYDQHDRKKFRPVATGWVNGHVTIGLMRKAIEKAKAESTEPIAYLPAYVDRVLASLTAPARSLPQETDRERRARERTTEAAGVYAGHIAKEAPIGGASPIDDDEVIHVRSVITYDHGDS